MQPVLREKARMAKACNSGALIQPKVKSVLLEGTTLFAASACGMFDDYIGT